MRRKKASSSKKTEEIWKRYIFENDFVSRGSIGSALTLQWLGTSDEGSVIPVLTSKSTNSLPGNPAWPRTRRKLRATREERESARVQIFRMYFSCRNVKAVEKKVRADWDSVKKRLTESYRWKMEVTPFQTVHQCKGFRWEARGVWASWVGQRRGG